MSLDAPVGLIALRMAIHRRQPSGGVVHHSDQGVQYFFSDYVEELKRHALEISVARTGNPMRALKWKARQLSTAV